MRILGGGWVELGYKLGGLELSNVSLILVEAHNVEPFIVNNSTV